MYKKLKILICLLVISLMLSGCKNVFKQETPTLEEKVNQEIGYLESEFIAILNSLNDIIYTNYKVIPTEVKENNTDSNPTTQMNESRDTPIIEQKESMETSGESSPSSEQIGKSNQTKSSLGQDNSQQDDSEKIQNEQQGNEEQSGKGQESQSTKTSSGSTESIDSNKQNDTDSQLKSQSTTSMVPNTILDTSRATIDWNKVKGDIEILYDTWITIRMDLKELGIPEEQLIKFSNELNNSIVAIKKEDKIKSMETIINMYGILYDFVNYYSSDSEQISLIKIRNSTLNAYMLIEKSEWEIAKQELEKTEQNFDILLELNKGTKLNDIKRSKILLQEMKESLELKDKQLSLLKYKNLIQELTVLQ